MGRPYREGDPICDFYQIVLFSNSAILCLTDGCNWGDKPRKASRIANKSIVKYMEKEIPKIKSVKQAIHSLLAAFTDGQLSILDNKEDFWMGGSTTAICCCLFSIDQDHAENSILQLSSSPSFSPSPFTLLPTPWVIVSVNVGDCKLLVYSPRSRSVFDVTHTTRDDVTNLTDPGGRLGSYNSSFSFLLLLFPSFPSPPLLSSPLLPSAFPLLPLPPLLFFPPCLLLFPSSPPLPSSPFLSSLSDSPNSFHSPPSPSA